MTIPKVPIASLSPYRPDIDGLRAVAILGVIAYHVGLPFTPGGYSGVDVFFVVSGFLITQLLVSEYARSTKISLSHFYERRARRLLPALCLVVFTVLLLGFALLPFPNAREQLGQSAISALLFVANRYFRLEAGNYFQLGSEQMPLLHTWSLAVEEQFYLVFPLATILLFKISAPANRLRLLTWSVAVVTAVSFVGDVFLVRHGSHRAFYWAPARAWEIGVGALLALWMTSWPASRNPRDAPTAVTAIAAGAAIAGVAMITGAVVGLKPDSPFPGMLALLPVLGTALIIGAAPFSPQSVVPRALSFAPVVALGRVSYPWYLWHWPLLVIARRWRLGERNLPADVALAMLALLLAALTARFVERPFRWPRDVTPAARRRFVTVAVASVGFLIILSGSLIAADRFVFKGLARLDRATAPFPCLVESWTDRLTFGTCEIAPPAHPTSVVVWGDSHADAWAETVRALGESAGVTVRELTLNTCPPALGLTIRAWGDEDKGCATVNDSVTSYLRSAVATGLRGAVLAARWPRYVHNGLEAAGDMAFAVGRDTMPWAQLAELRDGLDRTLAFTDSIGIRVLILLSPPEFRYRLPDCLSIRSAVQCGMSRAAVERYRAEVNAAIRQVASRHPNVRVIDPVEFFCDASFCAPAVRGAVVTYDANHISASAARVFAPAMRGDFTWLVGR